MQPNLNPRRKLADLNLDDLADRLGAAQSGPETHTAAMAEFTRRGALAQERVTPAQEAAATATKETAEATRQSARYIWWFVVVLAVASILNWACHLWERQ